MNTIVLTPDLLVKLAPLKELTTLKDLDGRVIGTYTPAVQGEADEYERIKALFDLEEAERALAEGGPSLSTQEVLKKLRMLEFEELDRREKEVGGSTTDQVMEYLRSLEPAK